jgi:hypothetical protein
MPASLLVLGNNPARAFVNLADDVSGSTPLFCRSGGSTHLGSFVNYNGIAS